jgi:hypothetical protein
MTDQITVPLTDDEATVLQIAAKGMPMIGLEHGRWNGPIDNLLKRGYLKDLSGDKFNCVITEAGRAVLKGDEAEDDRKLGQIVDKMRVLAVAQKQNQEEAEQCARVLCHIAMTSHMATGDDKTYAAEQWSKVILDRAKELLRG